MKPLTKVKTVQFAIGIDLMGSKLTLSSGRGTELEANSVGVMAHSKSTNRWILIPYSNCKGIEFFPPEEGKEEKPAKGSKSQA